MKLFCSIEDVFRGDILGVNEVAEVDLQGRRAGTLCLFHPDVRAFWTGLATDLCKSYDIDGILFFNERNGPLLNALGASHAQSIASSRATCFCQHHQLAAKAAGINFDRAQEGYRKLDVFIRASLKGERPVDGYFVEFWRLLGEFLEIMACDRLFDQGKHQVLAEVNAAVKSVRNGLQVGFHIEHVNSFNPLFRATRSYEDLAAKADFLSRRLQQLRRRTLRQLHSKHRLNGLPRRSTRGIAELQQSSSQLRKGSRVGPARRGWTFS